MGLMSGNLFVISFSISELTLLRPDLICAILASDSPSISCASLYPEYPLYFITSIKRLLISGTSLNFCSVSKLVFISYNLKF